MKTIIKKRADKEYMREKEREFEEKYGTLDSLGQKVSIEKCSSPTIIDDYEIWKASRKGAEMEEEIVFYDSSIFGVISASRAEILDFLAKNGVGSIKELAQTIKRDYKNVYFDIMALKRQELLEIRNEGREKIPVSRVERIEILFD